MAIGKTAAEIDRLHKAADATPGEVYNSDDGKQYLALESGRLKYIGSVTNEVGYETKDGQPVTTVVNIGKYNNKEIEDTLDLVYDHETRKADKCFAIAMSIVLG